VEERECRCGAQTAGGLRDSLRQQGMRFARTFRKQGLALSRVGPDRGEPLVALGSAPGAKSMRTVARKLAVRVADVGTFEKHIKERDLP